MRRLIPFALPIALLALGCRSEPKEDASAVVLKTYEVPKGTARSLVATLKDTFWMGEQQKLLGRASISPDGKLAVLAPANVQPGVQALVEEVTKHPPNYDQTIELH